MASGSLLEKIIFGIARQWIAGETINDALKAAQASYKNGMGVIINKLGEHHTSRQQIQNTVSEYKTIILSFKKWQVKGSISVKPTQLGLLRSKKECLYNFEKLINDAAESQIFIWVDMESSDYTDVIIQLYEAIFSRYERAGIALQANLKRTENDLAELIALGAKIRLVKGAYRESSKIAYKTKHQVDENYLKLMKNLFEKSNEFGIATHDHIMIDAAINFAQKYERNFEFQMLRGIRDELKPVLLNKGYFLSEYIPYGTNWLPYSIRRLKERKRNILLLGSSFISRYKARARRNPT